MADTNQSQQTASKAHESEPDSTPRTVASITKNPDAEPPSHAYDNPCLDARGFLLAVMHDHTLPLTTRIDAAARLLRIYGEDFKPRLTYRIEGFDPDHRSCRHQGSGSVFEHRGSSSDYPPEVDNGKSQSNLANRSNNHGSHDDDPGSPNFMTTNTDPLTFDEIQQIKAAVHALQPNIDLSQVPDHLTLCECGHWMLFPCKCASIN